MLKFLRVIPSVKMGNLVNNMIANRPFRVLTNKGSSSDMRLNNGLPQVSALHHILIYT